VKRRTALSLIAGGVAATAATAAAQTPLRIGAFPAEVCAEIFYAQQQGLFAAAGIAPDVQMLANGGAIAAGIGGGALDVGLSDLVSVISAHAHGLPFVYVAAGLLWSVNAPTLLPVVAADAPIRGPRDFNGKTVTVNGLNNIAQIPFMVWLDGNGGDSRSVKFVELPLPAMLPALQRGTVDAMVCPEPFISFAVKAGNRVVPVEQNTVAPAYLLSGYVASRDWIARNRDLARRFAAAIRSAGDWANEHPDLAAPILAKATNIPLPVVQTMHRGRFQDRLEADQLQPVIDAAARYGVIPRAFPAADIIGKV
jgi:NitT/TauT family transport system substrate-binding protein